MSYPAGLREHRIRFERRRVQNDGYGNTVQNWDSPDIIATIWTAFRPVFGREQVAAGRIESTMTGVLTILKSNITKTITAADRLVFVIGPYQGKICQIRSILPTPDNREIEFLIEEGVSI